MWQNTLYTDIIHKRPKIKRILSPILEEERFWLKSFFSSLDFTILNIFDIFFKNIFLFLLFVYWSIGREKYYIPSSSSSLSIDHNWPHRTICDFTQTIFFNCLIFRSIDSLKLLLFGQWWWCSMIFTSSTNMDNKCRDFSVIVRIWIHNSNDDNYTDNYRLQRKNWFTKGKFSFAFFKPTKKHPKPKLVTKHYHWWCFSTKKRKVFLSQVFSSQSVERNFPSIFPFNHLYHFRFFLSSKTFVKYKKKTCYNFNWHEWHSTNKRIIMIIKNDWKKIFVSFRFINWIIDGWKKKWSFPLFQHRQTDNLGIEDFPFVKKKLFDYFDKRGTEKLNYR